MVIWDPPKEFFTIPYINWPITFYGLFFATGFLLGYYVYKNITFAYFRAAASQRDEQFLKKLVLYVADKTLLYIALATVVGARLGHLLFYENFTAYLQEPWRIVKVWEGGLASHGAALGIITGGLFLTYSFKKKKIPLAFFKILDLICPPIALAGFFIRTGNFFNQEILGVPFSGGWGVLFLHPMDPMLSLVSRHPVQLYEAFAYLMIFFLLFYLVKRTFFLFKREGLVFSFFLILVFGVRFILEYWKEEQSVFSFNIMSMGQILSLPLILLGAIIFVWRYFLPCSKRYF